MPLATPIDRGAATIATDALGGGIYTFTGTNMSTAMMLAFVHHDTGQYDYPAIYFPTGSGGIHGVATVYAVDTADIDFDPHFLHVCNPIGYHEKVPSQILQDLIVHQAHVPHGKVRLYPNSDKGPNQWTASLGGPNHYFYVNQGTEIIPPDTSYYLETTTINLNEYFDFTNAPSNLSKTKEIIVNCLAAVHRGSDEGMAILAEVSDGGGLLKSWYIRFPAMQASQWFYCLMRVKIEGLDISKANTDALSIRLKSHRDLPGGAPDPRWRVYAVDLDCYYETTDIDIVDEVSFDNQDSYFSTQTPAYILSGDIYGKTFREALLHVLIHAPELFIYISNDGKLTLGKIPAYSGTPSPYMIGPEYKNYVRFIPQSKYDERTAKTYEVKFGSRPDHITSSTNAKSNPDNTINLFSFKRENHSIYDKDSNLILNRPLLRVEELARVMWDNFINLYTEEIDVAEVEMNHHIFDHRVEIGEVIALDIPELGIIEKKFLIVGKTINLDLLRGKLLLYDMEF